MSRQLVILSWKDIRHPAAGGAELVHQELSRRWVRDGWRVIHLVPGFPGAPTRETVDGIEIVRIGRSVLAFYLLPFYYAFRLRRDTDILMDVFCCFGSGCALFSRPGKALFTIYHIQDRMWFYQTTFPHVPRFLMPVINSFGFVMEKLQLLVPGLLFRGPVITISESTASELSRYGFRRDRMLLMTTGIEGRPLASPADSLPKERAFTVLLLGPRKSKRPLETLRAFHRFQQQVPEAVLWIAGWGTEHERLRAYAKKHSIRNLRIQERVSREERDALMQRAHVLCTSPVKEGWGILVIEANAVATPVIGYRVPGLQDALAFGNGICCDPHPSGMAEALFDMHRLWKEDRPGYEAIRGRCLQAAHPLTFDRGYDDVSHLLPS